MLKLVNIFARFNLISITCIVLARQRQKIEDMNRSAGNFACQGKSGKTLIRKLGRKRS